MQLLRCIRTHSNPPCTANPTYKIIPFHNLGSLIAGGLDAAFHSRSEPNPAAQGHISIDRASDVASLGVGADLSAGGHLSIDRP